MSDLSPLAEHDNPQRRAAQRARWAARPRPEVTLDQLHTFLAVAERQHVSEAAEALGISQGSVSTVVHRLEKRLGLPLFQRVGRNVRLTDVGRALRPSPPGSSMTSPCWTSCGSATSVPRSARSPSPPAMWSVLTGFPAGWPPSSASTRSSACTSGWLDSGR